MTFVSRQKGKNMKNLLKFLSVPVAAIALTVILGIAGGIENETVPFPAGAAAAGGMILIEMLAIGAVEGRERDKEDEDG